MEAVPKVHRQRHRRSSSRRTQERNNAAGSGSSTANSELTTAEAAIPQTARERRSTTTTPTTATTTIFAAEEGLALAGSSVTQVTVAQTRLSQENERQNSSDAVEATETTTTTTTPSLGGSFSQQTVVLVNGYSLPDDDHNDLEPPIDAAAEDTSLQAAKKDANTLETTTTTVLDQTTTTSKTSKRSESPQPNPEGSSRNSSGDAMSLRETLQQLQPTVTSHAGGAHNSHPRHHRRRTSHSPQSPAAAGRRNRVVADPEPDAATSYFHRGIIGFMDREIKTSSGVLASAVSPTPSALSVGASGGGGGGATKKLQSLSDPTASPAQRSTRSRSSLEKSPRRKRSKSESRRRRERKLIAAGEMEVRQANETLMRYLKQCSEMNDASLSGELEIDQNFDERRVHRKTKSQRDKRGHLISKLYSAGGLSSILKELSDDIVPADGEEIYNPFTPVVSPTEEDTPAHIDKMFIQTSSGYRPVDHCYYKHSFVGASRGGSRSGGGGGGASCGDGIAAASNAAGGMTLSSREAARLSAVMAGSGVGGMRGSGSYSGDTRCLLDAQCRSTEISSNLHLACVVQRIWLLVSNICHGLLAGLALAHLLFVITSHPMDWSKVINDISLAGEATLTQQQQQQQMGTTSEQPSSSIGDDIDTGGGSGVGSTIGSAGAISLHGAQSMVVIADYAAFAEIYANTFYCLAIVCLVSVFDRMDICHLDLSNATELVSFRWIIIAMIYIATIILSICSNSIDEKLYFNNTANVTLTHQEMLSNQVLNVWNSLSVARSLGAIFGWLMIGLTPHDDLLYEHLLDLAQYQTNN